MGPLVGFESQGTFCEYFEKVRDRNSCSRGSVGPPGVGSPRFLALNRKIEAYDFADLARARMTCGTQLLPGSVEGISQIAKLIETPVAVMVKPDSCTPEMYDAYLRMHKVARSNACSNATFAWRDPEFVPKKV